MESITNRQFPIILSVQALLPEYSEMPVEVTQAEQGPVWVLRLQETDPRPQVWTVVTVPHTRAVLRHNSVPVTSTTACSISALSEANGGFLAMLLTQTSSEPEEK